MPVRSDWLRPTSSSVAEVHYGKRVQEPKQSITPPSLPSGNGVPYLTEDMTSRIHAYGRRETFAAQTVLWSRGERQVDMFVVLNGAVNVYVRREGDERTAVATLEENQFSGELDLLNSPFDASHSRTAGAARA